VFKFITGKSFLVNLLVVILVVLLLIFLFFSLLGIITKHNETTKVPSVAGRSFEEAKKILETAGLEAAIQDSVYADTARPMQVLRQSPDVDAVVKEGRTIYLTVNRLVPPQVEMPDLRGFSIKSAELYLQSLGLKMGEVSYVPDIARNAVKEQLFNDQPITPGTKINVGSIIALVVGNGVGNEEMEVPDIVGLTVEQAKTVLSGGNIELGAVIALDVISDTANSFVAQQKPDLYSTLSTGEVVKNKIRPGQIMDIWISSKPVARDTTTNPTPPPVPSPN
jgi:eukaryotic-like serine/threonine-protein kinase